MAFPRWWQDRFLLYEGLASFAITLALVIVLERAVGRDDVVEFLKGNRAGLYTTLATTFGSLLGFTLTALTVLIGFAQHERMAIVRESAAYPQLWGIFTNTIWTLGGATLLSFLALLIDRDSGTVIYLTYAVIFVTILSLARICRAIWVVQEVIHIIAPKKPAKPKRA